MIAFVAAAYTRLKARLDLQPEGGGAFGPFEAGVLLIGAVGLTIMQFGGAEAVYYDWFADALRPEARPWDLPSLAPTPRDHRFYELLGLTHWATFCLIGYVLVPAIYLKATGRSVIAGGYLSFRGFREHVGVYLALFGLVMTPVVIASYLPEFQAIYPFYRKAGWSAFDLIAWELAYGVQFFALEFFFRGFLLEGLRRWLGYGAVFVMVVPYCMLHFQKTAMESLGSIIAGVILGVLAMRYRSIWGGVLIHWLVAIAMDVLSLWHKEQLPTQLWP